MTQIREPSPNERREPRAIPHAFEIQAHQSEFLHDLSSQDREVFCAVINVEAEPEVVGNGGGRGEKIQGLTLETLVEINGISQAASDFQGPGNCLLVVLPAAKRKT